MSAESVEVDPWDAARRAVDALTDAGVLGRDPVTRAEAIAIVEAEIRASRSVDTDPGEAA